MIYKFSALVIDFFGKRRSHTGYGVVSVLTRPDDYGIVSSSGEEILSLPHDTLREVSRNTFGGLTLRFSAEVEYRGDFAGGIGIKLSNGNRPHFDYQHVASVRNGKEVVWKNHDVPRRKRKLTTST